MKKGIHPQYQDAVITCACGEVIHIRSTRPQMHVEVCSKCHPFYTGAGEHRLVDTAGRIEKFRQRYEKSLKKEK